MNKSQEKIINYYKKNVLNMLSFGNKDDKYEIKNLEINENDFFVEMRAVVGMKNDEGTMASLFCREKIQIFIGKRGGVTYPLLRKTKDGKINCYTKALKKYGSLLRVSYEQSKDTQRL